jgi:hypothetical protein
MASYTIERYGTTRFFAVRDAAGALVCVCVYKRGAHEVARRLQALDAAQRWRDTNGPPQDVPGPTVQADPATWER